MCAPKVPKPKTVAEKPVQYLRNPFLDDLSIGKDAGRNSLRIDLGSTRTPRPSEGASMRTGATAPVGLPVMPGLLIPRRTPRAGPFVAQR